MRTLKYQLAATAHHEAGHAVANWKLGFKIRRVTIVPRDGPLGTTTTKGPALRASEYGKLTGRRIGYYHDMIVSQLAGEEAQRRFDPRSIRRHHYRPRLSVRKRTIEALAWRRRKGKLPRVSIPSRKGAKLCQPPDKLATDRRSCHGAARTANPDWRGSEGCAPSKYGCARSSKRALAREIESSALQNPAQAFVNRRRLSLDPSDADEQSGKVPGLTRRRAARRESAFASWLACRWHHGGHKAKAPPRACQAKHPAYLSLGASPESVERGRDRTSILAPLAARCSAD
jgi:hypothetical protein